MKKLTPIVIMFICLMPSSCANNPDPDRVKNEIINVIENEKDAYFESDLNKINDTWDQDSSSLKLYASPGHYKVLKGWEAISKENEKNVDKDRGDFSGIGAVYSNYDIILNNNTAVVYHDASFQGGFEGNEIDQLQKRILNMVKVNGAWKINTMNIITLTDDPQLRKNGMVCCWNFILKTETQPAEFERFVLDEYIPAFEKNMPGVEMILTRGERGDMKDQYRIMLIMDSIEERNDWWPEEGESSEKRIEAAEKMMEISEKFQAMSVSANFTDWLIL
jgi:hypothetical protein